MNSIFRLFESLLNQHGRYKVFGKIVKYNQLVQNGNFESKSIWTATRCSYEVANNEAILTITDTSDYFKFYVPYQRINGHKYLALFSAKASVNGYLQLLGNTFNLTNFYNSFSYFYNATLSGQFNYNFTENRYNVGDKVYIKNAMFIDLTDLFGAGNEPTTLEQFYATDLGKEIQKVFYPPYSPTNTIYEADLSEATFSNRNLFVDGIEGGGINSNTGQDASGANSFRSKGYIEVKENTTYLFKHNIEPLTYYIYYYDSSYNYINSQFVNAITEKLYTTPANCKYIRFSCWKSGSGWQENPPQVNILFEDNSEQDKTYIKGVRQTVSILQNGQPLKIGGIGTAKDYYLNASGKKYTPLLSYSFVGTETWLDRGVNAIGLSVLVCNLQGKLNYRLKFGENVESLFNLGKTLPFSGGTAQMQQRSDTKGLCLLSNGSERYVYAIGFTVQELTELVIYAEAQTPTTEQANSVMLPKNLTKCYDKNNLELEIEVIDPLNFSNKIVQGKNAPTITAEKVITKGFTSGGEHFTQLYIYEDGEIWYVNNQGSAQAYASGVWELEYKQLQFDNKVSLTESERNALLNIYDLL